jgi:MFS family permease
MASEPALRAPIPRLAGIVLLSFGLTLVSATLEPALLGHKVIALFPDRSTDAAAFGAITFGGLLVAVIAQPLIGAWSDRTRTPLGRRLPFMLIGALGLTIGLTLIASARTLAVLVIGLLITQLGLNSALATWQPVIAEGVATAQRGLAAGFKASLDLAAAVVGRLAAAELVSRVPAWGELALYAAITVPVLAVFLTLAITVWAMGKGALIAADFQPARSNLREMFSVDLRRYPAFGWWCVNRVLFWASMIGASAFLLFAARDVFGLSEPEAQRVIGQVSVVLGIALGIVVLPAGWLADRLGRRPMMIAAGCIAALGAGLAVADFTLILPVAILIGIGAGIYLSSSLALINDIVPQVDAARYLGVANIATATGSALARLGGGATISSLSDTPALAYKVLYAVVALAFLLSAFVIAAAPHGAAAQEATSIPSPNRASARAGD